MVNSSIFDFTLLIFIIVKIVIGRRLVLTVGGDLLVVLVFFHYLHIVLEYLVDDIGLAGLRTRVFVTQLFSDHAKFDVLGEGLVFGQFFYFVQVSMS